MKMVLTPLTKPYLDRQVAEYMSPKSKLTEREIIQLFQDLIDCGYAWQIGGEISLITRQLVIKGVIQAPEGMKLAPVTQEEWDAVKAKNNKVQ